MNSPLLEFETEKGQTAYAKNKQYTHILMNCDKFGWAVYMPTDEVKPFDGTIDTGRYFIETTDYFALHGNGWYCDSVVERALTYKLITPETLNTKWKHRPFYNRTIFINLYWMFMISLNRAENKRPMASLDCLANLLVKAISIIVNRLMM